MVFVISAIMPLYYVLMAIFNDRYSVCMRLVMVALSLLVIPVESLLRAGTFVVPSYDAF